MAILAAAFALTQTDGAHASGAGSPEGCDNADALAVGPGQIRHIAPVGRVVTYICIQSGAGSFAGAPGGAHSVPLLLDGLYGLGSCFRVAGIGDATLVVNSICQPIAHVDIFYDAPPTAQLFRVSKNFLPPLIVPPGPQVFIALSCTSGLVSPPSATVGEFFDAFFTVTGAGPNTICTAVELTTVPGYTGKGFCSGTLDVGFCTLVNIQVPGLGSAFFSVVKDFQPDAPNRFVTVSLTCNNATVVEPLLQVQGDGFAVFTVTNVVGDPLCFAQEIGIPTGYVSLGHCTGNLFAHGTCTIVNVLVAPTVTPTPTATATQPADTPTTAPTETATTPPDTPTTPPETATSTPVMDTPQPQGPEDTPTATAEPTLVTAPQAPSAGSGLAPLGPVGSFALVALGLLVLSASFGAIALRTTRRRQA